MESKCESKCFCYSLSKSSVFLVLTSAKLPSKQNVPSAGPLHGAYLPTLKLAKEKGEVSISIPEILIPPFFLDRFHHPNLRPSFTWIDQRLPSGLPSEFHSETLTNLFSWIEPNVSHFGLAQGTSRPLTLAYVIISQSTPSTRRR